MPDRLIRESICTSETLNALNDFEERFWHRLTVNCDDYGRFDARPAILKGRLFPLMENKTLKNMADALKKLASVGLVELYEVDGKPFLQVVTWNRHQRIRAKRSKYPAPSDGDLPTYDSGLQTDAGNSRRNPIQSESESNAESNPSISTEPQGDSVPVFALPLNDGTQFPIFEKQIAEWSGLYPAVDIMQDLRGMKGWLDASPEKRKTKRGILRFITGWLSRTQDKGGNLPKSEKQKAVGSFADVSGDW